MTDTASSPASVASPPGRAIPLDTLRRFCATLLQAAGLDPATADLVADSLSDAEARGIGSHGVQRTRIYVQRLRAGLLDATAVPRIVKETPSSVLLDARNAIGHVGARAGIDLAIARAETGAVCAVGVRNSNHCGTLAFYLRRATERSLVALAMSNAPPTMAYHGGRTRAVGTNPLAIGIPSDGGPPLILDMATSATARGKIILADQLAQPIPPGWAVDVEGRPTTDTQAALRGAVLPFAGPKGSGLAMMIELLCGGLMAGVTGALVGDMYDDWSRPQQVSHLFIAIDPDSFLGRTKFLAHVKLFTEQVHGLPAAEGFTRVSVPGEIEDAARSVSEQEGVMISETVIQDLQALAGELGVAGLPMSSTLPPR
ncbi:MAG TPA: Ldh family oxidoreductase [Mycobacteriales bacterium]|jgi:LDH2 family malate/lactate/ureidoglycolate dehydrogenase